LLSIFASEEWKVERDLFARNLHDCSRSERDLFARNLHDCSRSERDLFARNLHAAPTRECHLSLNLTLTTSHIK